MIATNLAGDGDGNPFQYSCLRNPMDRGARQATVHGGHKIVVTKLFSHNLVTEQQEFSSEEVRHKFMVKLLKLRL